MAGLVGPLRIGAWLFGSRGPAWPCAGGPGALLLLRRAPAVRASSSTAFTEAVKDHIGTGILTKADQSARRLAAHAAKREHFLRPPEPAPVYTGPSVSELFELELSDAVEPADADALRERALVGAGALTDAYEAQLLCEAVVVSLVRERRTEAAWDAFTAGRLHGITPTPAAYAAMIQACALDDEVERAERVVSDMQSAGIWPPPAACWDNLLFAYASRATALTRLTDQEKFSMRRHNVPTAPASVVDDAVSVLRRMGAEGLAASASTHLGLLRVLAAAGQARRAQAVLAALLHARAPVGEAHFACAIDACGMAARLAKGSVGSEELLAEGLGVLEALEAALGRPPSTRSLRAVLRAYATTGRLVRTLNWLERGYAERGQTPTPECYGVVARMCRNINRPDVAVELLRRARSNGIELGANDGTAAEMQGLASRWLLGSALVRRDGSGELHVRAASRVLLELAFEMERHPPLVAAALDVRARAELGNSEGSVLSPGVPIHPARLEHRGGSRQQLPPKVRPRLRAITSKAAKKPLKRGVQPEMEPTKRGVQPKL